MEGSLLLVCCTLVIVLSHSHATVLPHATMVSHTRYKHIHTHNHAHTHILTHTHTHTHTLDDVRLLFSVLDKNKTGAIGVTHTHTHTHAHTHTHIRIHIHTYTEFDEFVMAIRGDLNARRRDLVFKVTLTVLHHGLLSRSP
jgi:hypothetical protein